MHGETSRNGVDTSTRTWGLWQANSCKQGKNFELAQNLLQLGGRRPEEEGRAAEGDRCSAIPLLVSMLSGTLEACRRADLRCVGCLEMSVAVTAPSIRPLAYLSR